MDLATYTYIINVMAEKEILSIILSYIYMLNVMLEKEMRVH